MTDSQSQASDEDDVHTLRHPAAILTHPFKPSRRAVKRLRFLYAEARRRKWASPRLVKRIRRAEMAWYYSGKYHGIATLTGDLWERVNFEDGHWHRL
jgi:hypothetical protein